MPRWTPTSFGKVSGTNNQTFSNSCEGLGIENARLEVHFSYD